MGDVVMWVGPLKPGEKTYHVLVSGRGRSDEWFSGSIISYEPSDKSASPIGEHSRNFVSNEFRLVSEAGTFELLLKHEIGSYISEWEETQVNDKEEYKKLLQQLDRDELIHNCLELDKQIDDRNRLLEAIPECEIHGKCIPHAIEWVGKMKRMFLKKDAPDTTIDDKWERLLASASVDPERTYLKSGLMGLLEMRREASRLAVNGYSAYSKKMYSDLFDHIESQIKAMLML